MIFATEDHVRQNNLMIDFFYFDSGGNSSCVASSATRGGNAVFLHKPHLVSH